MKVNGVTLTGDGCIETMTVTLTDGEVAVLQALLYGTSDAELAEMSGDADATWHALQVRAGLTVMTDKFHCREDVG